jgi:hypothetical protein
VSGKEIHHVKFNTKVARFPAGLLAGVAATAVNMLVLKAADFPP